MRTIFSGFSWMRDMRPGAPCLQAAGDDFGGSGELIS